MNKFGFLGPDGVDDPGLQFQLLDHTAVHIRVRSHQVASALISIKLSYRVRTRAMLSKRLLLRPVTVDDASAMQVAFADWNTVRYLSAGMAWPFPPGEARRIIEEKTLPAMARGKEWCWSIVRRGLDDQAIGMISLFSHPDDNRGFWLAKDWRGKGFMFEACGLATRYWFDRLGYQRLRVNKAMLNNPSVRLASKEGMSLISTEMRPFVAGNLASGTWELTRDRWNADAYGV